MVIREPEKVPSAGKMRGAATIDDAVRALVLARRAAATSLTPIAKYLPA